MKLYILQKMHSTKCEMSAKIGTLSLSKCMPGMQGDCFAKCVPEMKGGGKCELLCEMRARIVDSG